MIMESKWISVDKQYNLQKSDNYLCVPTILSIIIDAEQDIYISPYNLADSFTINVPHNYPHLKNLKHREEVSETNLLGIVVSTESINNCLKENNIPLRESFISIHRIPDFCFEYTILKYIQSGRHIVCGFDYGYLYNKHIQELGHVSIITAIDINNSTIELLDPGPDEMGIKHVSADKLYEAILRKNDGIWLFN